MELNDLKQSWSETTQSQSPLKNNIMDMIKSKSYGPLAVLELKFKKQIWGLPAMTVLIIIQFYRHSEMLKNPAIWFLYATGIILCVYFLYNYLVVKKLQNPQFTVKENIESQIHKLENSFKWYRIFVTAIYILVPIGLELATQYKLQMGFEQWYTVNILIRIVIYIAAFVAMYFINQRWFHLLYGQHFSNLKKLAEQL